MRRLLSALFLLLLLGAGGTASKAWLDYKNPGPLAHETDVVIPHGDYLSTIHTLQQAGVLHPGYWTEKLCLAAVLLTRKDGPLHAAELHFPAFVSMQDALHIVRHGRPVLHKLTIPEGLTAHQIQALLQAAPLMEGDAPLPSEGSVMPETYGYLRNTTRKALLERTQAAMTKAVQAVWSKRTPIPEIPDEQTLVTLASLVEKETAVPAERPLVARVFINRLQQAMKLQTDPTVIYALTQGVSPLGRALTHADLQTNSPYNTYMVTGLPPGPICSPGLSSLEAAAHPADGAMLYFVANGQGGHSFAASLTEHNKNVHLFRQTKQAGHALTPQP